MQDKRKSKIIFEIIFAKRNKFISIALIIISIAMLSGCRKQPEITLEEIKEENHYSEQSEEFRSETEEKEYVEKESSKDSTETKEDNVENAELFEKIYVYVCGSVQTPGVYELDEKSRVCDAIAAAGGVTERAAGEYLNQAKRLEDGERIYIPTVEEMEQAGTNKWDGIDTNTTSNDTNDNGPENDGKIHLNSASLEELMTLTGIGKAKATAIVSYREKNGSFTSVEQLMQVEGIKEATFEKIKDEITL